MYLKMIRILFVILVNFLVKQRYRVTDKQMSNVLSQQLIDAILNEIIVNLFVVR